MKMVFRVDPEKHLPTTMKTNELDDQGREGGKPKQEIEAAVDYPDAGPIDVFALGVPRTVEVVDCFPKDDV